MSRNNALPLKRVNITIFFASILYFLVSSVSFANVNAQAEGWDYAQPVTIIGVAGFFLINPRFFVPNIIFSLVFIF